MTTNKDGFEPGQTVKPAELALHIAQKRKADQEARKNASANKPKTKRRRRKAEDSEGGISAVAAEKEQETQD